MHMNKKLESTKVEILYDEEIDNDLEDVMSIEKEVECLECEKWLADIRKKVEELEKLEIIGKNLIRNIKRTI